MDTGKQDAGPSPQAGAPTKISTATKPQDRDERSALVEIPVVVAVLLVAARGARYDRLLVRRCVWCGFPHLHIRFEQDAGSIVRNPACSRSRQYLVRIGDELPTAADRQRRQAHLAALLAACADPKVEGAA